MKSIEERAKEYSTCDEDCALCSEACRKASDERAFIAGAQSEREELTRWHDPKEELPEDDREVLCIVNRQHRKYAVLRHDNYGWWQYVPFQGGGWCGYDGEVCGWRPIHETMKGRLLYSFFEYKGSTYQVRATKAANRCSRCHAQPCKDRKIATLIKYFGPCLGEERSDGIDVIFRKVR